MLKHHLTDNPGTHYMSTEVITSYHNHLNYHITVIYTATPYGILMTTSQ